MAIGKVVRPYELLARWRDGVLTGAHVQFISTIVEDGVVMLGSEHLSDAMPVDVGGVKGFPLADILQQLHTDALVAVDAANAEKKAAVASEAAANAAKEAAVASEAVARATIVSVIAELAQEKAAHAATREALLQPKQAAPGS